MKQPTVQKRFLRTASFAGIMATLCYTSCAPQSDATKKQSNAASTSASLAKEIPITKRDEMMQSVAKKAPVTAIIQVKSTPSSQDEKMKWWRDARFGMFIHWGSYSVLGGVWKGKDYSKETSHASSEHIRKAAKIPDAEYVKVAEQFDPTNFNAAEWVSMAKAAGMKYMVITAKHHEGFAMFDTHYTDYSIMKASPFKRDIVKELADECHKQGVRFGVYYSHNLDWHHAPDESLTGHPLSETEMAKYHELVKGQLTELLTKYGEISAIWFDMAGKDTAFNNELGALVHRLQPQTIISSRLYSAIPFEERKYADYQSLGDRSVAISKVERDTECPMTTRLNWGYAQHDDHCKSVKKLVEYLAVDASHGANMILNVGPKPDGTIPQEEAASYLGIGKWLEVNGESIYCTKATPLDYDFPWGLVTQNPEKKRLYLHILKWNPQGIELTGVMGQPSHAYLLADPAHKELTVERKDAVLTVKVPETAPDGNDSVIVLEFPAGIKIDPAAKSDFHWQPTPDVGMKIKIPGQPDPKKKKKGITSK